PGIRPFAAFRDHNGQDFVSIKHDWTDVQGDPAVQAITYEFSDVTRVPDDGVIRIKMKLPCQLADLSPDSNDHAVIVNTHQNNATARVREGDYGLNDLLFFLVSLFNEWLEFDILAFA